MKSEDTAPSRQKGEDPGEYIIRYAEWLNRPHRRRIGDTSKASIVEAVRELQGSARQEKTYVDEPLPLK